MSGSFSEGVKFYKAKRYKLALEEFFSLEDNPADNADVSYYIGLCYSKLEEYNNALLYLEQVVTLHSNLLLIFQCRLILSYIYNITGRYRLAEFELEQLVNSGFESAQVFAVYGYTAYSQARTDESLTLLQKALKIDPDNANALNSIGYIMAEEELDTASAISYCKSAVRIKPENWAYLDSLGWAHYKAGNMEESKDYLRKALNLSGGHKTIALHMREVLNASPEDDDDEE